MVCCQSWRATIVCMCAIVLRERRRRAAASSRQGAVTSSAGRVSISSEDVTYLLRRHGCTKQLMRSCGARLDYKQDH